MLFFVQKSRDRNRVKMNLAVLVFYSAKDIR